MSGWWWQGLIALLIWPGLLGGALLGWFLLWLDRKLTARLQGRQGPPFYQPFFDFVKLMGKTTVVPGGVGRGVFYALPLVSVGCTTLALMMIPAPGNPVGSFAGDVILLLYLLEMPAICDIIAGYASRSLYGQVSASREALLSLGHNLPFLAAVIALAIQAGSFRLGDLAAAPIGATHIAAGIAYLLSVPARLHSNPFSIPNAEQEIVEGTHIEYNGPPLALFELAHGLEMVALAGLFSALFVPPVQNCVLAGSLFLLIMAAVVVLTTVISTATARSKIHLALRFYWSWGAAAAVAALVIGII